jgi:alpha-glucosidase
MKALTIAFLTFFLLGCPSPSQDGSPGGYPWANDPEVGPSASPASTVNDPYWGAIRPVAPDATNSLDSSADWYKDAIFYHLWVPAFADSNGDGIGDIQGIIDRLDYLQHDLGVTAIWLSPIFKSASSPPNLHGYDATDLYRVDPRLGSNYRLQTLIRELHARGMRIIYDHVPNHVSSQHPWFLDSANSTNGKRDWFIWKTTRPSLPAWTGWDSVSDFHGPKNGAYYYGIFWDGMPDLNYETLEVRQAMANVQRGWLNFGFDGIRMDAVKYIYEDWTKNDNTGYSDQAATFEFWQKTRSSIMDVYNSTNYKKFMVAENWTGDQTNLLKYMKDGSNLGFHMTLDFPFAYAAASLNTTDLHNHWTWVKSSVETNGGWMGTFTSNHDNAVSRPMTEHFNDTGKVRAQAALLILGVGTPFIYYGNEIGMTGAAGDDINLRQPLSWSEVSQQKNNPQSLLNWHKALNTLRKNRISLRVGSYTLVHNAGGIFAFERIHGSERTLVVLNLNGTTQSPALTLSPSPTGAVTLFGTSDVTLSGSTVTVSNMLGYAVRVFKLENSTSETTLMNDVPYNPPPPPSVNLMGITNWTTGNSMMESSGVYSVSVTLSGSQNYQFKFKQGSSWYGHSDCTYDGLLQSGSLSVSQFTSGGAPYHNISFTPSSSGSYTFFFRLSDKHYAVKGP